ncbi:glycosyl hydrolase [Kineococcus sp. SYSU DK005]|uniref:glycosyl hydrolase n=1 Tax=Kineococcus sp. SYSU DK005 TaxID=3383126 RepID=UPI003D7CD1C7
MNPDVRRRGVLAALAIGASPLLLSGPTPQVPRRARRTGAGAVRSAKKGVAAAGGGSSPSQLRELGTSWYYDWSDGAASSAEHEYVPMLWGSSEAADGTRIATLTRGAQQGRYSHLLAFNEPDKPDQSNVSPEQALQLWPALQSTGLRLGSPAPANYWGGWLDTFMDGALQRGYRVDFLALHYYPDFTDPSAVEGLRAMVQDAWDKWRRPVWITEIGAIDISAWGLGPLRSAPSHALADDFARRATTALQQTDAVERYAWFIADSQDPSCRFSTLYGPDGELTSHGLTYAAAGAGATGGDEEALDPRAGSFRPLEPSGARALHATDDAYANDAYANDAYANDATWVVSTPASWSGTAQRWSITPVGAGTYHIASASRPGALLQATASTRPGAAHVHEVVLTPASWGSAEQLWRITGAGQDRYTLLNVAHDLVLSSTEEPYGTAGAWRVVAVPFVPDGSSTAWRLSPP